MRFTLASRRLNQAAPAEAYGLVHDALAAQAIGLEQTPSLLILEMSDPTIRELRRLFGKTKTVEGMRLGLHMIGNRFVEDGIVFPVR